MPNLTDPESYGRGKASTARRYAEGDVGVWIARATPHISHDAPRAAWVGVCCNGGVGENTTGWLRGDEAERAEAEHSRRLPLRASPPYSSANSADFANYGFHELGPLGVEGGPATGLAPGRGEHDSWLKLAIDDSEGSYAAERTRIRAALGRNAVTSPGSWVAVADSVVIGMANNARCARRVRAALPEALRWPVDASGYPVTWSAWSFAAATMGWSAGVGGAARHLGLFADATARVPDAQRWGVWLRELTNTRASNGRSNHSNPYYSALRTAQKFEAGVVAAQFTREPDAVTWLRGGLGADRAAIYAALARGVTTRGGSDGTTGTSSGSSGTSSSSPDDVRGESDDTGGVVQRVRRALPWVRGVAAVVGLAEAFSRWMERREQERALESEG